VGQANFRVAGAIALLLIVANLAVAWAYDLPVRDPDGVVVPTYVRLPVIVLLAFLLDVVPRAVLAAWGRPGTLGTAFKDVVRRRWDRSHVLFMLGGLGAWYVCYATFRNLKSYVPFVNHHIWDDTLARIDRILWLGHDPATVLHAVFGTGVAAHFFSAVYIAWIGLIPISLAIALVWTRSPIKGAWYVTAIAFDWVLGVAVYYLVPTLGPIYTAPENFAHLAHTDVTTIEAQLLDERIAVLADPWATQAVQTIAAFASLHVGMMMTICLIAELVHLRRWLCNLAWVFFALTVLATVYLGWHFFVDTLGGMALGAAGVWLAAMATGNLDGLRPRLAPAEVAHEADFSDSASTSA
jgi:hypothetical protein